MRFRWVMGHEHAPVWWNMFVSFFWSGYQVVSHRSAIPNQTRVRYDFKTPAGGMHHDHNRPFDVFSGGEGVVVAYEYDYQAPADNRYKPHGMYANNTKFPKGFIVKDDTIDELVSVPIENAELISGYRYAIPALNRLEDNARRIGDLPIPLSAYTGDIVRLKTDAPDIEREMETIFFSSLGRPYGWVGRTNREIEAEKEARRQKGLATGRAWGWSSTDEQLGAFWNDDIVLVRRGNVYHLMHGSPDDLVFESLEDEIDFWKRWAGEWLADTRRIQRTRYSKEEAKAGIEQGTFDIGIEMFDGEYTPIRILDRYEKFRARARIAGLTYLRENKRK